MIHISTLLSLCLVYICFQVGKNYVKKVKIVKDNVTNLLSTNSTIQLELTRNHFNENGRLKVRCTASLYSLYWQIIEKGTEREKQKSAMVAASNTADVQPYWRDTYKISGSVQLLLHSFVFIP